MKSRKAQAALEFMMSYGWILLVTLVGISSTALFGILDPSKFVGESCTIEPGFACNDANFYWYNSPGAPQYDKTGLIGMRVTNGMGKDISHAYVMIDPEDPLCGGYFGFLTIPPFGSFKNGETRKVNYYFLDMLCSVNSDCSNIGIIYPSISNPACHTNFNLCVDTEPGLRAGATSCNDPLPCANVGSPNGCDSTGSNCICDDIGIGDNCYEVILFSNFEHLVCRCADAQCQGGNIDQSYNCCQSQYTTGTANLPTFLQPTGHTGFCPGFPNIGDTCPGTQPPYNHMDLEKLYKTDFQILYKFVDSNVYHSKSGTLRLKNGGIYGS